MIGERIRERLNEHRLSQSELARRVSLTQGTIAGLVTGKSRSSAHLHKIAAALQTTPAYLTGETDDPDLNAPPPPPPNPYQLVTLQVALPPEAALARMFEGMLAACAGAPAAELPHALAALLPSALGQTRDLAPVRRSAPVPAPAEAVATTRRARPRAQRT